MRTPLRVALLLALGACVLSLPACGGGASSSAKPKVAVVTNCTADFWSICEAGANKAAKEHDVELFFRQPTNRAVPDQMEVVEAFLKKGISGLAISVLEPKEQTPDLTRIAKEVNLLTMDNDADQSGRLAYIGIDNYEAGKAVGRLVKQALPNGGAVALFIGSTASANGKARSGGVLDELAGEKNAVGKPGELPEKPGLKGAFFGKYFLVQGEPLTDEGKSVKATDNAKEMLEKLRDVPNVAMVGLYAYNPPAILEAAAAKSLVGKITIVGFDEDWNTLKGVADGQILGTVVQDPFNYGYQSVAALAALARGDKSKLPTGAIPYRVVTKDGGPDQTVNGLTIKNLKAADFEKKLRDDLQSAKK